jgi:hypothetical protein
MSGLVNYVTVETTDGERYDGGIDKVDVRQ